MGYFIAQTSQTANAQNEAIGQLELDAIHFLMQASTKGIKLKGQDGFYGSGVLEYGFDLTHRASKLVENIDHLTEQGQSNRAGNMTSAENDTEHHETLGGMDIKLSPFPRAITKVKG